MTAARASNVITPKPKAVTKSAMESMLLFIGFEAQSSRPSTALRRFAASLLVGLSAGRLSTLLSTGFKLDTYCMTIRLALIGSAFCGRNQTAWTRTWPQLLLDHWGSELEIVAWGQAGGLDIEDYMPRLSSCDWDLAFVFHLGYRTYPTPTLSEFQRRFTALDQWLRDIESTGLRQVVHFTSARRGYTFLSGRTEFGIIEQLDWDRHHRVRTTADHSDNMIDQVGNWRMSLRMNRIIEEYQERRLYSQHMIKLNEQIKKAP